MVVDPEVVRQLLRRRRDPLERLTPREREVLALIAEGKSNGAIARQLVVSEAAVGKHIGGILTKLDLPCGGRDAQTGARGAGIFAGVTSRCGTPASNSAARSPGNLSDSRS